METLFGSKINVAANGWAGVALNGIFRPGLRGAGIGGTT